LSVSSFYRAPPSPSIYWHDLHSTFVTFRAENLFLDPLRITKHPRFARPRPAKGRPSDERGDAING